MTDQPTTVWDANLGRYVDPEPGNKRQSRELVAEIVGRLMTAAEPLRQAVGIESGIDAGPWTPVVRLARDLIRELDAVLMHDAGR